MPPKSRLLRRRGAVEKKAPSVPDFLSKPRLINKLSAAELEEAGEAVTLLAAAAEDSNPRELLLHVDEKTAVNVLLLYSAALRRSGTDPDDRTRTCYRKLRVAIHVHFNALLWCDSDLDVSNRRWLLSSLFLRTHGLRWHSLQLAQASKCLRQRLSRRNVEAAVEALTEARDALNSVIYIADCDSIDWESAHSSAANPRTESAYLNLLAREISDSHIISAWAACYVQLLATGEWSATAASEHLQGLSQGLDRMRPVLGCNSPTISIHPALLFLTTSHVVHLLSLLDDGSTYGLPPAAPEVPIYDKNGIPLRRDSGGIFDSRFLLWGLSALVDWFKDGIEAQLEITQHADPQLGLTPLQCPAAVTTAFDIALRLANAALASWMGQLVAGAPGRRQRSAPVRLDPRKCYGIASTAIMLATFAFQFTIGDRAQPNPEAHAARRRNLWAFFVAVNDSMALCGEARGDWARERAQWEAFEVPESLLEDPSVHGVHEAFPQVPGHEATAILELGAIRCYERNLRRASSSFRFLRGTRLWSELLMFGNIMQLAGVVTSLAKLIRLHTAKLDELPPAGPGKDNYRTYALAVPGSSVVVSRMSLAWDVRLMFDPLHLNMLVLLDIQITHIEDSDHVRRMERMDSLMQMVLLWSWASIQLLPAEARALQSAVASDHCRFAMEMLHDYNMWHCSWHVLLWCSTLLHANLKLRATAASVPMNEEAAGAAIKIAEEWRRLLIQDVDIMGVLGASARLLIAGSVEEQRQAGLGSWLLTFQKTLILTTVAFPDEFLAAVGLVVDDGPHSEVPSETPSAATAADSSSTTPPVAAPQTISIDLTVPHSSTSPTPLTMAALVAVPRLEDGSHPLANLFNSIPYSMWPPPSPSSFMAMAAEGGFMEPVADLLMPPSIVRKRMEAYGCANPSCLDLSTPWEMMLARRRCRGCEMSFCSAMCQEAHWHRAMCRCRGA